MIEPIYQHWFFHRPALAQQLLHGFAIGTGDPIALMGERRIGKTLFLLNDLIPAATRRGFISVYVDLWQKRDQPLEAINYALQESLDDLDLPATKLRRRMATPVKKIGFAGTSLDFGEEPARRRPTDSALLVDWLIKQLLSTAGKPLLLIFDEIQELAHVAHGENIVSALRTAITKYKSYVRVVFTGSSESALRALLQRTRAALYEGASTMAFPHLDRDFLRFVADRAQSRLHLTLREKDLMAAFERLHHRPRPLIDLVLLFASSNAKSLQTALDQQIEAQLNNADYFTQWQALKPLQQAICLAIVGGAAVSSQASRERYARDLGQSARKRGISPGTVVRGLKSLQAAHVITQNAGERGQYHLDDPLFAEWIKRQHGDQAR